jgi:hypothetical protein
MKKPGIVIAAQRLPARFVIAPPRSSGGRERALSRFENRR